MYGEFSITPTTHFTVNDQFKFFFYQSIQVYTFKNHFLPNELKITEKINYSLFQDYTVVCTSIIDQH